MAATEMKSQMYFDQIVDYWIEHHVHEHVFLLHDVYMTPSRVFTQRTSLTCPLESEHKAEVKLSA